MFQVATIDEVFSPDELAQAAGVPRRAVEMLILSGGLQPVAGTGFISADAAVRAAEHLRATAVVTQELWTPPALFSDVNGRGTAATRLPVVASSCVHGALLLTALWLTTGTPQRTPVNRVREPSQLVFLMSPGPGGGGGGSGGRQRQPPRPLERRAPERRSVAVPNTSRAPVPSTRVSPASTPPAIAPKPTPQATEPLIARTVIAPIVVTKSGVRDAEGVVDRPASSASTGPGAGGNAGTGSGAGNGEGLGSGIGDGAGGGAGGGPFRPGSGIEPPRLLREVKAVYTEEARVRGITGAVILEIVVRRDGSVGDVTLRRGLSPGLDREAIAAVRQWTFAPARRLGAPVDVLVEVAVEFTQR